MSLDSLQLKQKSYLRQQYSTTMSLPENLTYPIAKDSKKKYESKKQQDNLINVMQFLNIDSTDRKLYLQQHKDFYTAVVPNNKFNTNSKRYIANFPTNCNMLNMPYKSNMEVSNTNQLVSNITTNIAEDSLYTASMDFSKLQTLNGLTLWQSQQEQQNNHHRQQSQLTQLPQNFLQSNNSFVQVK